MKLLADFFPVILFFAAYKLAGIYTATAVAIAAALLQVGYGYFRHKKVEKMHLFSLAIILVFGGLTLLLHDRTFIMWKPSIFNWAFGAVLLGSQLIGDKPLIRRIMEGNIELPDNIWQRLNLTWALFFIGLGFLNLYVANDFFVAEAQLIQHSGMTQIDFDNCGKLFQGGELEMCNTAHSLEQGWVNFKLFGMMGLTFAFILLQGFYLVRHMPDNTAQQEES
jgi:intracellular septation protein